MKIEQPGNENSYLKIMVYGEWGVGKTTLAASAADVPEMKPVLYVDAESGSLSLKGRNIDVVKITQYDEIAKLFQFLHIHARLRDSSLAKEDALEKLQALGTKTFGEGEYSTFYQTVVIDSLSEIQKYCLYQLLDISVRTEQLDLEPKSAEFKQWGQQTEMIRLLVRSFRNLPMHVIFILGEQETEVNNIVTKRPLLAGKLATEVQGFLDIVGYYVKRNSQEGATRRLYLESSNTWKAKHRFVGFTERYVENPTMNDLYELL